jgi:hypothetical protein
MEQVIGSLLDVLNERISVRGLAAERLEDHHLERAGKKVSRWRLFHRHGPIRHRLNKYTDPCQYMKRGLTFTVSNQSTDPERATHSFAAGYACLSGLLPENACAVKAGAFQWELDPPGKAR